MPFGEKKKRSLGRRLINLILGTSALAGATWGIIELVFMFTAWNHAYELRGEKIIELETMIIEVIDGDLKKDEKIDNLLIHQSNKGNTFQVGKRTEILVDEETGIKTTIKKYRDWDGVLHEVHKDHEMTESYGIDYYYYISKQTGLKVYVW